MRVSESTLHGVYVFEPEPRTDERGFFMRVFSADVHARGGIDHTALVQENQSRSRRGTIRGLHTRRALSEAKLVRCVRGGVWDVAVDLRPWSPTFGRWESFELDEDQHRQVYIPPGFAHGFQAVTDLADVCYRVDAYYEPDLDVAIAYDDPDLAIPWPLDEPIVSERDRTAPHLAEVRHLLADWYGSEAPLGHGRADAAL